jgi:hypothetical protein
MLAQLSLLRPASNDYEPEKLPGNPIIITLAEFAEMRLAFAQQFRTKGDKPAVVGQEQEIPWTVLMSRLDPTDKYLAIHYGLKEHVDENEKVSFIMRYGFSILGEDAQGNYDPPIDTSKYAPEFEWDGTNLVNSAVDVNGKWVPGETYRNKMRAARFDIDEDFEDMDANDARICIFPFAEQIHDMYEKHGGEDDNKEEYRLELCCFARNHSAKDGGPAGFRHGLCLCIIKKIDYVWQRQLSNEQDAVVILSKGSDYGNLCPPRCLKYVAPVSALQRAGRNGTAPVSM